MRRPLWLVVLGILALGGAAAAAIFLLTGPGAPGRQPAGSPGAPGVAAPGGWPPAGRPASPAAPLQAAVPAPSAFPPPPPPAAAFPPPPAPPAVIPGPPVVPLPANREKAVERIVEVRQERFENAMDALNRRTAARRGIAGTPSRAGSPTVPVASSRRGTLLPKP